MTAFSDYEVSNASALIREPVVSVLMLAYNHAPYLAQAIDGVLAQRADISLELLIAEDYSTDETRKIAFRYQEKYPEVIRIITSDTNVGANRNHRRILLAARGIFCAYLDGDDYWLPGKLATQVSFLRENADCTAVFTNALTVDRDNNRIGLFNDVGDSRFDLGAILRLGNFLNNSSILYRTELRVSLLEVDEPAIDFRGHLRLARAGLLAHIGQPLVAYRVSAVGSMILSSNDEVRKLYWEAIMDVPRDIIADKDFARGVANFLRRVVLRSIRTRRWSLFREWAPKVFAASPYGRFRTSLLTVGSIFRITAKELMGRFRKGPDGHRLKVLYRR